MRYCPCNLDPDPLEDQRVDPVLAHAFHRAVQLVLPHRQRAHHHHGTLRVYVCDHAAGDLSSYLKNLKKANQRMNEKMIAYWFIQLLFGIKTLHKKSILHRDLKSANIFLTKNKSLKIGDFGISKILECSSAITCIGTPLYLSP